MVVRARLVLPRYEDPAPVLGEGSVLRSVDRELVDDHADRRGDRGRQLDGSAAKINAARVVAPVGFEQAPEHVVQLNALPACLGNHLVGESHRADPAGQRDLEVPDRFGPDRRLLDDGDDRGQVVLHAMVQFLNHQLLSLLGVDPLGDLLGHPHDPDDRSAGVIERNEARGEHAGRVMKA